MDFYRFLSVTPGCEIKVNCLPIQSVNLFISVKINLLLLKIHSLLQLLKKSATFFASLSLVSSKIWNSWIPWNLSFRYIRCTGQFTPKMKANTEPRLLSSLVGIDSSAVVSQHRLESFFMNKITSFMDFMLCETFAILFDCYIHTITAETHVQLCMSHSPACYCVFVPWFKLAGVHCMSLYTQDFWIAKSYLPNPSENDRKQHLKLGLPLHTEWAATLHFSAYHAVKRCTVLFSYTYMVFWECSYFKSFLDQN